MNYLFQLAGLYKNGFWSDINGDAAWNGRPRLELRPLEDAAVFHSERALPWFFARETPWALFVDATRNERP